MLQGRDGIFTSEQVLCLRRKDELYSFAEFNITTLNFYISTDYTSGAFRD